MGDYVHFAIRLAGRMGFRQIIVSAFFGKAMKIAQGLGHTHASRGEVDLDLLSEWTRDLTGNAVLARAVTQANTARGALELLLPAGGQAVVARVGNGMLNTLKTFSERPVNLEALLFSSEGQLLWQG
jgi:cobalt-precorrin-5B (C1)-methyltransferase